MKANGNISISIIVPVYNASLTLKKALDSALSQTLEDIEIICINDGSTDNSLDILRSYEKTHKNIYVINQENSGAGIARNQGLNICNGEYVAFLDPDDWYPDITVLSNLYASACLNKALIVGGNILQYHEGKSLLDKKDNDVFLSEGWETFKNYQCSYYFPRFIFNRDFLKENEIRFPSYRRYQDPPFLTKALSLAGIFYKLPIPCYSYRVSPGHVNWSVEKIIDYYRGNREMLELTQQDYPALHSKTYSDLINEEIFLSMLLSEDIEALTSRYEALSCLNFNGLNLNPLIRQERLIDNFIFNKQRKSMDIRYIKLKLFENHLKRRFKYFLWKYSPSLANRLKKLIYRS